MSDLTLTTLLPFLHHPQKKTLWIADENISGSVSVVPPHPLLHVVSNRFDIASAARAAGHNTTFSDMDFSSQSAETFERIAFRIAKEKAVNHHVINEAFRLLHPQGELLIAGMKNEGIKSLFDNSKTLIGNGLLKKHGSAYLGHFTKTDMASNDQTLDSQDYSQLRLLEAVQLNFYSKPGLFGWNKIDEGSAFLAEHLPAFLSTFKTHPSSMLDLGCGYGYLTLMTRELPLSVRVATDNNAAALLAMQKNAEHHQLQVTVHGDDCASSLTEPFDMILCNPPFHQGFDTDGTLIEKFLQHTHRLLKPEGKALFVVNSFIGLESVAASRFSSVVQLANNRRFKLVSLKI